MLTLSLKDSVRLLPHLGWNRHTNFPSGLEIEDQFRPRDYLDRKFTRRRAFQNL